MDKIIRIKEGTLERLKELKKKNKVTSYDKVISILLEAKVDITDAGVFTNNEVRDGRY